MKQSNMRKNEMMNSSHHSGTYRCWPAADAVCSMEVLWCFTISCSGIHGHKFIVVLEKQGKRSEKVQLIHNLEFQKCYKIPTYMKTANPPPPQKKKKEKKEKKRKPSKFNLKHKLEWYNETITTIIHTNHWIRSDSTKS